MQPGHLLRLQQLELPFFIGPADQVLITGIQQELEKELPQERHMVALRILPGLELRWTLVCLDRWSLRANFFSQREHSYGLMPEITPGGTSSETSTSTTEEPFHFDAEPCTPLAESTICATPAPLRERPSTLSTRRPPAKRRMTQDSQEASAVEASKTLLEEIKLRLAQLAPSGLDDEIAAHSKFSGLMLCAKRPSGASSSEPSSSSSSSSSSASFVFLGAGEVSFFTAAFFSSFFSSSSSSSSRGLSGSSSSSSLGELFSTASSWSSFSSSSLPASPRMISLCLDTALEAAWRTSLPPSSSVPSSSANSLSSSLLPKSSAAERNSSLEKRYEKCQPELKHSNKQGKDLDQEPIRADLCRVAVWRQCGEAI
ncbi:hypothetical protein F7725_016503 [Dissostichus mawsoni]|uniref:Uncharacterized protein n=1 Tax=Dissostichus mawsoni TaxID=36200 RepID=A0A7J5Z278_DISMA|nr:hypothetical protein F7725_016503 [Dissostichus mawsoni]